MKPAYLSLLFPLLLVGTDADANTGKKVVSKANTSSKKVAKRKEFDRTRFRPDKKRAATHIREGLKPRISIATWGIETVVTNAPVATPRRIVKDPYAVGITGAPRGTQVKIQAFEKSANISTKAKPNQKTVAEALRLGPSFETHTITQDSSSQQNLVERPQELDTMTPYRASFKDVYNRTARVTGNAKGRNTAVESSKIDLVKNRRVTTVVSTGGIFLDAYQPWANVDNIRITPASRPFGKADYLQAAKGYSKEAAALRSKVGKYQTTEQSNQLRYLDGSARAATGEARRITRIERSIARLSKLRTLKSASKETREATGARIAELKAQLPSTASTSRFVGLAAFPPNATIILTNLRLAGKDSPNATVSLKANGSGSVAGEFPAWQQDRVQMTVTYPGDPSRNKASAISETFVLPKNSNGSGFLSRGEQYMKLPSAPAQAQ